MAEPMSDERLAEIRRHDENGWYAHGYGADVAVRELLAEVERLNLARDSAVRAWKTEHDAADELQRESDNARAQLRTETDIAKALLQDKNELAMRAHRAEVRAETAERELAEMRKQLGNATVEWASDTPGFFFTTPFSTEDGMRNHVRLVREEGGNAVLKRRLVGEWKPAEQQPEDGIGQAYTADANQPEIRDRSAWCWNKHPDHPLPCGRLAGHDGQHARGERRWNTAQPEDGDRG